MMVLYVIIISLLFVFMPTSSIPCLSSWPPLCLFSRVVFFCCLPQSLSVADVQPRFWRVKGSFVFFCPLKSKHGGAIELQAVCFISVSVSLLAKVIERYSLVYSCIEFKNVWLISLKEQPLFNSMIANIASEICALLLYELHMCRWLQLGLNYVSLEGFWEIVISRFTKEKRRI